MSTLFEKVKRPLFAFAMALGFAAGAVQAVECYTDTCYTNTCASPVVCAAQPVCGTCEGNPSLSSLARTNLPGYYSNDYDYSMSARTPTGIDYLIPTQYGLIESPVIPLTNPVDRYYATHTVRNGQVVDESASYRMALSTPTMNNPNQPAMANAGRTSNLTTGANTYANANQDNDFANRSANMTSQETTTRTTTSTTSQGTRMNAGATNADSVFTNQPASAANRGSATQSTTSTTNTSTSTTSGLSMPDWMNTPAVTRNASYE